MEQQTVILLFTFNRLKLKDLHTELESVYGPEASILPKVKNRGTHFQLERTDLIDAPDSQGPCTSYLGETIVLMV
jgi:hypothetical protein